MSPVRQRQGDQAVPAGIDDTGGQRQDRLFGGAALDAE
jgi:hypothetical protein